MDGHSYDVTLTVDRNNLISGTMLDTAYEPVESKIVGAYYDNVIKFSRESDMSPNPPITFTGYVFEGDNGNSMAGTFSKLRNEGDTSTPAPIKGWYATRN